MTASAPKPPRGAAVDAIARAATRAAALAATVAATVAATGAATVAATVAAAAIAGTVTAAPAAAQSLADYDYEYLAFRGVGLDYGYIWPDKVEDTHVYSLRLDLGYLGPGVRIAPTIGYWRSRFTDTELDRLAGRISQQTGRTLSGSELGPILWSDIFLSIDGHFVWNTPINVLLFVGLGGGLHALNGQGAAIDDTFVEDLLDSITAGVSGLAGVEFQPLRRVRVYGEGRYTALHSVQYLSARVGLQLMFPGDEDVRVGAVPAPALNGDAP